MEKNRAIPEGYMTVGELAKRMGVTVRTLQYYDREGVLSPSAESEGGRRLYSDREVVSLHQILSLKHLGFSLDDIKNRLACLDTPADVANALAEQAAAIRDKIRELSEALRETETLQAEVLQMQAVDFKKYADIIINLQMKNEFYWLIKHLDDNTLDDFRERFDKDSGLALMGTYTRLNEEAVRLYENAVAPGSKEGMEFAKAFWDMITEFTGGDMGMLQRLMKLENVNGPDDEWKQKQTMANAFIESALEAYFDAMQYDPLAEEQCEGKGGFI